jgi:phosphopantothenate---cysteine ligase (CTP)
MPMSFANKKILMTSGGTIEKWDQVRGHTNFAKGTIGCYIAEELLAKGAQVYFLHGYFAKTPAAHPNLITFQFEGILHLQEQMKRILEQKEIDIVIMSAAVSDWQVEKICDQQGNILEDIRKISSDHPPVVYFKKAPKVIKNVKKTKEDVILVGFKLEHTNDKDYPFETRLSKNGKLTTSYAILLSLYMPNDTRHYIVSKSGRVIEADNKKETAEMLANTLQHYFSDKRVS